MLDLDGTIYQTLDLKERARHATIANDRSVGIEIATIGAYPAKERQPLDDWYPRVPRGSPTSRCRRKLGDRCSARRASSVIPARPDTVHGVIQGEALEQYDLTPQQYAALIRLTATLCKVFPNITC